MFLSKLALVGISARNPYDLHRQIWKAFPGRPDDSRPFLFRMEWVQRDGGSYSKGKDLAPLSVLLQSDVAPASPPGGSLVVLACKEFEPRPRPGQILRFSLCANPTKRLNRERAIVPLLREEERLKWLAGRLGESAQLAEASITDLRTVYFRPPGGRPGKIVSVTYTGYLQVKQPAELVYRMKNGIGRGKAFGCGLLTCSARV